VNRDRDVELDALCIQRIHLLVVDSQAMLEALQIQAPQAQVSDRVIELPDRCHSLVRVDTGEANEPRTMFTTERRDILVSNLDSERRLNILAVDHDVFHTGGVIGPKIGVERPWIANAGHVVACRLRTRPVDHVVVGKVRGIEGVKSRKGRPAAEINDHDSSPDDHRAQ
jgi:hypothetical protein